MTTPLVLLYEYNYKTIPLYDNDTKLYWIGDRWYDPERGRYISSASPEMLLQNASVVFGLNLYGFSTNNPVNITLSCGSIYPSLDFYYNGEYKSWWDQNKNWVLFGVGVAATILACVFSGPCGAAATAATIGTTLCNIATATIVGAAISLAIGGAIAGIQSALTGHGFWEGFADSVTENFVDALVTSFATSAVTIAAGNFIKHAQCFKEGTLVETEDGLKPIEEIEVGDMVLAYDEETGEQAYKPVVRLFRNESKDWTGVTVNGTEIVSTPGHKYYLPETKIWVSAEDLKVGTKVLLSSGSYGIIKAVRSIHYDEPQTTYNFEVEDFHTYYVGNGVLVHNMNQGGCSGRGANNPKTKESAARGREIHRNYDYGPGVSKEVTIPGYGRADGVDFAKKIVYELKPDNPRAISRGLKQLDRYIEGLGEGWTGKLITYK